MALTQPSDKMLAPGSSLTLATKQASTSGTSIDFTGIPAGTKRIEISFVNTSIDSTAALYVQLGDAGGVEASGYHSYGSVIQGTNTCTYSGSGTGNGFYLWNNSAAQSLHGVLTLLLHDAASFTWVASGVIWDSGNGMLNVGGSKSLSAELDRIRITSTTGTANFDAGSINIAYK